jgi:hypothetical protein
MFHVKHFGTIGGLGNYTARHGSPRQMWVLLPRKDGDPRIEAHRARAKKAQETRPDNARRRRRG